MSTLNKQVDQRGWETLIYLSGTVDEVQREISNIFQAYPPSGYATRIMADMVSEDGDRMTTIRRDSNCN